jgi:hypothetical protein
MVSLDETVDAHDSAWPDDPTGVMDVLANATTAR